MREDISDKPLRILHVVLSMAVGGAEKLVFDMARYPNFAANRPVVACLDMVGELGEKLKADGYTVYLKNRQSGLDRSVIPWLRDIIRRENITVVHAHQYTPLFYAVPAALLSGRVKVVYTEHGRFYPDRKSWKRAIFNPFMAYGVDHLVSISFATAEAMSVYDHFPRRRIKVIHNGINLEKMNPSMDIAAKRRELGIGESCHILGTAARLEEIKNMPMMLRVFKILAGEAPDTVLLIAGQGSQTEKLKTQAKTLGISEKVKFIGLRFDLEEVYPLMDIFLLTSFTEGISVTLLEAMASGVPAVVTDVGGNKEVVVAGETGYLLPLYNEKAMADQILNLIRNPEKIKTFGLSCQKRVRDHFSFSGMIKAYEACYRN